MIEYTEYLGWCQRGNSDDVVIVINVPDTRPLNPDSLIESKSLLIYGRRNGKLRSKLISRFDTFQTILDYRERGYEKYGFNLKKLKHLETEIKKHMTWAMLQI